MGQQRILPFISPATGEQFGQVSMATTEQVHQAACDLRDAFPEWSQKPVTERVRILRQFQKVMLDSVDEITAVMNQDCGKSRQDALVEVFITADMLLQYLKNAGRWLRRKPVSTGIYLFKRGYVEPRPYGVVAVLAPWNYPFALALPPVLGALLAGNTVMLKPSEVTGATGILLERLFRRVPELAPYVRVLHGDGQVGAAMIQARPDYVFLTGSTSTGRKVMQAAAEHLIPVACELGGKDAMIVLEDADLRAAAHWGVWGSVFNAGQTCMAVERVYVVEAVYDSFLQYALESMRELRMGYTQDIDCPYYLGPVTDPRQVETIRQHLDDALAKGARLLAGGRQDGSYFEPSILVDVDHGMLLMQEETFGPLMPIMKVKDEAEAIRLANDCRYGLGASIWSRDLERAQRVAHQVEAASVIINDTIAQFAIPQLPFGGIKQSGFGRTHGKEGLMQFTRPFSYAVGQPPYSWDLVTIARKPGNYHLLSGIMRLLFGVTPEQRVRPVVEACQRVAPRPKPGAAVLGLSALAVLGALAGVVLTGRRGGGS